ncbi:unnamed protein product [Pedinophyceae sp. YPF-701]|nr:unnamed protein product [Pedinophyceae sp. YPF-701]
MPHRGDDRDGHLKVAPGDNLSSRFKVLSQMGEGTFGRVMECWDRERRAYCAIKIIRNVEKYRHAAMIELEVLNTVRINDPAGSHHCVPLLDWFDFRGHICMVFERLGPSLFDFIRKNGYKGFPLAYVQSFARQLLESVAYLHSIDLCHTDLKPENILAAGPRYVKAEGDPGPLGRRVPTDPTIRVIDFGSATFRDQYHCSVVSTRHYRAPEIILGIPWSAPCDVWSVGCIMVELVTGDALYQTHDNLEHLAMMEQTLGPIPASMVQGAHRDALKYFAVPGGRRGEVGALNWPTGCRSARSLRAVQKLTRVRAMMVKHGDPLLARDAAVADALGALIEGMLEHRPGRRMTAREALAHPFFSMELELPGSFGAAMGGSLLPRPRVAVAAGGGGEREERRRSREEDARGGEAEAARGSERGAARRVKRERSGEQEAGAGRGAKRRPPDEGAEDGWGERRRGESGGASGAGIGHDVRVVAA